ncbi:hypothetical protein ABZT34_06790 [Streptomyces sp. NPDC005329]|uniref:hypothetical protein n=1 Tax=Streptomyces sp. NPDC005329 TaxID=3157034 RepID=UPI0033B1F2FE
MGVVVGADGVEAGADADEDAGVVAARCTSGVDARPSSLDPEPGVEVGAVVARCTLGVGVRPPSLEAEGPGTEAGPAPEAALDRRT